MPLMSDQQDALTLPMVLLGLVMDAGNQGTHGVDDAEVAFVGALEILRRRAVGGENDEGAFRYLVDFLDCDGALAFQLGYDIRVVDDLVLDVHGRTEAFQTLLYNVDGPDNAGAKTAGRTQYDFNHLDILSGCATAFGAREIFQAHSVQSC
jgi:hypothetical protein